jgi:uncharacterized protein (TIGR03118 family)
MSIFLRHLRGPALALSLIGTLAYGQQYNQTNLVDSSSDADLVNAWGLSRGSGTPWWVSDNATGLATLYNGAGAKQGLKVTIPAAVAGKTGSPTGTIFNGSKFDFLLGPKEPALFLFCTIDGTVAAWNPALGTTAKTVIKTTDHSVFTGMTSFTNHGGKRLLYLANFGKGRVDVYDSAFHLVPPSAGSFTDDTLPANFVPFNIQLIGENLVVTYALHEDNNPFETDGPGLGYVDIYSQDGRLLLRLEHGDWLNAPWGVALAPLDFGTFSHALLIGQFAGGGTTQSSGYIAAYDMTTGRFRGLLEDTTGNPLAINGIWALSPGNTGPNNFDSAGAPATEVYFSAGPNHASEGRFGYLTPVSSDLTQGNNQ